MYIVNAPFMFSACWSIVKHWISKRTREKVSTISKRKKILSTLQQSIDLKNIPTFLGGESETEEKYQKSYIEANAGP